MTRTTLSTVGDMTFGLILPNKGLGASPELLDAGTAAAVDAGWRSAWVTDHLMVPRGEEAEEYGTMLEALTTLAWVGGRHEDIVLGTSVISPAMRDAPQLAKELATLDVLLGGRLTVGVGASDADDLPEYENMGKEARFEKRGAYVDESIRLWRHLWSGDTSPFEGEFHTVRDFTFGPLPVRKGATPIWAGGRSARAVRRTAELCDGYHAAQTSPDDLLDRIPALHAAFAKTRRPLPFVSTRARVFFGGEAKKWYALIGSPDDMVAEVVSFARNGNHELMLVFEGHTPDDLADDIARFQRDVVEPASAAFAESPAE